MRLVGCRPPKHTEVGRRSRQSIERSRRLFTWFVGVTLAAAMTGSVNADVGQETVRPIPRWLPPAQLGRDADVVQWMFEGRTADLPQEASSVVSGIGLTVSSLNPFDQTTLICLELAHPSMVRLAVFDGRGRRIRRLAASPMIPGRHVISWDERDDVGRPVDNGVYFVWIGAGETQESQRLDILR